MVMTGTVWAGNYRWWLPWGLDITLADAKVSEIHGMDIYSGQDFLRPPWIGRKNEEAIKETLSYEAFYKALERAINGVYVSWNTQGAQGARKVFLIGERLEANCLLRYLIQKGREIFIDGVVLVAPDPDALWWDLHKIKTGLPILLLLPLGNTKYDNIDLRAFTVKRVAPCALPRRLWQLLTCAEVATHINQTLREWSTEKV